MEKDVKLIYAATPTRNIGKTKEICDFIYEQRSAPLHPFNTMPFEYFENGFVGRERTLDFCLRLVNACDEFWLFGISHGTLYELNHAIKEEIPIKLFHEEFDMHSRIFYDKLKHEYNYPLERLSK